MARIHFFHTVWFLDEDDIPRPADGVQAQAFSVSSAGAESGSESTIFANRTGGTTANGLTNANGVVSFYLDPGEYNIHFEDPEDRIANFSVGASSIAGSEIQLGQIPTLTTGKLPTLTPSNISGFTTQVQSIIDSQDPLWLPARARLFSTVDQAIAGDAAFHQVTFDTASEDFSNGSDTICDVANNRLIIPYNGMWLLQAGIIYDNTGGGDQINGVRLLDVRVGSTTRVRYTLTAVNVGMYLNASRAYYCTAGQLITAWTFASNTGSSDVNSIGNTSGGYPYLEATYLGPRPTE